MPPRPVRILLVLQTIWSSQYLVGSTGTACTWVVANIKQLAIIISFLYLLVTRYSISTFLMKFLIGRFIIYLSSVTIPWESRVVFLVIQPTKDSVTKINSIGFIIEIFIILFFLSSTWGPILDLGSLSQAGIDRKLQQSSPWNICTCSFFAHPTTSASTAKQHIIRLRWSLCSILWPLKPQSSAAPYG